MNPGRSLRKALERLTGLRIYRSLPRGVDLACDIAKDLPGYTADMILDVGANEGMSATSYLVRFPRAFVHCFEPVSDAFGRLQRNVRRSGRVECHRLALGASARTGRMAIRGTSDLSRLLDSSGDPAAGDGALTESVDVVTVDGFCAARGISRVSLLKIDTEGGDLDILRGSAKMLSEQRVDFVEVEAGMNPGNTRHVPFEALKAFLESYGYLVFGIYEQVREWPTGEPHLRRTNPVFVSRNLAGSDRFRRHRPKQFRSR